MPWLRLCLLGLVWLCWKFGRKVKTFFQHRSQLVELLPGAEETHHCLLGHYAKNPTEARETYIKWTTKNPRMYVQLVTLFPVVSLHHPETIAQVVTGRQANCKPEYMYGFIKDFMGNGLVTSSGKKWSRDRRLLSKAFSPDMLRSYVDIYKSACATLIKKWLEQRNDVIAVEKDMAQLTYDVILQTTMGCESNCQLENEPENPHIRYLQNARWLSNATSERFSRLHYHNTFFYLHFTARGREFARRRKELVAYCCNVIEKRRGELDRAKEEGDEVSIVNTTMLDAMITVSDEDGHGLSTLEISDHVNTFLDAGHDTTSYTLHWLLYYLCVNQDVQEKCRSEIKEVLTTCGGIEGLERDHINELLYVTQVVNETLRIASLSSCFARTLSEDTKVDGHVLPKGTMVQVTAIGLHHNPEIWPDSMRFDPDRFSPENCMGRHHFAFKPFGAGLRSCIGKHLAMDEVRVVLAMLLSTFCVHLADDDANPPDWVVEIVSKPRPGIKIQLEVL